MTSIVDVIEKWRRYRDSKSGSATTPITIIFIVLLFLVIWGMFLGGFINMNSATAINDHGLGGFQGFLWANLNIIIFICLVIFILAFRYVVMG